jgi:hypothetical protein
MRRSVFTVLVACWVLFSVAAVAAPPAYRVRIESPRDVDTLEAAGLSVGTVGPGYAVVHPAPGQEDLIGALGYAAVPLPVPKAAPGYPSPEEVSAWLAARAAQFPDLCRVSSIGVSAQGRPIEVIRVTDNPGVDEEEPEARLVGGIHGNEPLGPVLLLRLLDDLLLGHGTDPRVTELVNGTDIHLMPLMNPDGHAANARFNAAGVDLNRDFPMYPDDFTGSMASGEPLQTGGRQPETVAVMQWSAARRFAVSAILHTGALVVNYPYDDDGLPSGQYAATPDDGLFRVLSQNYADRNPDMLANSPFPGGIVNGSVWYVVRGGMMDWSYRYTGCLEVTIELSEIFAPSASTWDAYHEANGDAMLAWLESAHGGVRGVVTCRDTGLPLSAVVTILENGQAVMTDPAAGDYHRPLLPGAYSLAVSAPGYQTHYTGAVAVDAGAATRADVVLEPLEGSVPEPGPGCPAEALLKGQDTLLAGLRAARDAVRALPGGEALVRAYYARAPAWTPAARNLRARVDTAVTRWRGIPGRPASPRHG